MFISLSCVFLVVMHELPNKQARGDSLIL